MRTLFFDLDGTLSDPKEGITKSVAYALEKFDIHIRSLDDLVVFIGPPLADSFMKYYDLDEDESAQAIQYYREYFTEKGIFENVAYGGIDILMQHLTSSGYECIVATSKPEIYAEQILDYFDLRKYFKDVCGATLDGTRSRKGDVIAYALQKHDLRSDQVIMIGDREHDVLGAKQNGLYSIGVLYGYGDRDELEAAGADSIVCDVLELKKKLLPCMEDI